MTKDTMHFVYQQPAIEMVTVAAQTCLVLEHIGEESKAQTLDKLRTLLPLLYIKAHVLPCPENELDGVVERFVTEEDYDAVLISLRQMLGDDDSYLEVLMEDGRYSDEPWTMYVSEGLADIYQELKDLAANYQTGNESVMNDALVACLEAYKEHWGQKVLNVLRVLHALALEEKDDTAQD